MSAPYKARKIMAGMNVDHGTSVAVLYKHQPCNTTLFEVIVMLDRDSRMVLVGGSHLLWPIDGADAPVLGAGWEGPCRNRACKGISFRVERVTIERDVKQWSNGTGLDKDRQTLVRRVDLLK